jgi:hypothetical protein
MKRISALAKELGVSPSIIFEYCNHFSLSIENANVKINDETEQRIINFHRGNLSDHELPEEFLVSNPFANSFKQLTLEHDSFADREPRMIEQDGRSVNTILTDLEAFTICHGLDDTRSKHIARSYFKKQEHSNILEGHKIAMSAVQKYGTEMISYVISLPALPFMAVNATQVFTELDKRKESKFPILRIVYKNKLGLKQKIHIYYYAEKAKLGRQINKNILVVKNQTTNQIVMKISRSGIVLADSSAREIVPILQLFIGFSADTKKFTVNYGLETGECSVCGRELSDSKSIRRGVGPVCAQYI